MLLTQQVSIDSTCDGQRHRSTHQSKKSNAILLGRRMPIEREGDDNVRGSARSGSTNGKHLCDWLLEWRDSRCGGVHLTSAAALTPAAARWAASSYRVVGTPATAGSVDKARDFLALSGLAPEPSVRRATSARLRS